MLKDQQKKKKKIAALQIKRVSFSVWKLPAFYFFFFFKFRVFIGFLNYVDE